VDPLCGPEALLRCYCRQLVAFDYDAYRRDEPLEQG
jgi:hypothetical protein